MATTIDSDGRIVMPEGLRDDLGLVPGSSVDISRCGNGLQLIPTVRTARLIEEGGVLVASGDTVVDDELIRALVDSLRRRFD